VKPLYRARSQTVESRSWMFLGENGGPCDQKCPGCYYAHLDNLVFYSLETMIGTANLHRHYYGVTATDITGGEATIYKGIVPLVRHCANIGLRPTIITHAQLLRDDWKLGYERPLYQEIEDAGLDDWLVSLHGGSAASHDAFLGKEGSFDRLLVGINNVTRPVRFNTTLVDWNYKDLPVDVLLDRPPTVWNAINWNPFHFWSTDGAREVIDFQATYREIAPYLARAIEQLEPAGWEVNVRYWPLCIAEEFGFAENVSGFHQVPFDPWEWRLCVTNRVPTPAIDQMGGWYEAERAAATATTKPRANATCSACRYQNVCDKPPQQYQAKYGIDELRPTLGELESDPLVFQRKRQVLERA